MNYKDCLILATILFWPNNRFDCEAFAKLLSNYGLYGIATDKNYDSLKEIIRRTSSDLDRLYRMQLLGRKRAKRIAITRHGIRNRGFKYEYCISKQGWQYFIYLLRQVDTSFGEVTNSAQGNKLPLTGDPLLEPLVRQLARGSKISPRALDLVYKYVELLRNKGRRYNRFKSTVDRKLLVTLLFCAIEMQDRFQVAEAKADMFIAAHKHLGREPEDIHRSRIIEAFRSGPEGFNNKTKVIRALADRMKRFIQSSCQPLPVLPKHPYVIVEVDAMLQQMARYRGM